MTDPTASSGSAPTASRHRPIGQRSGDWLRKEDRHKPFTDLLDRVAVTAADDPVAFSRIRARLQEVREWFALRCGWSVIYTRDVVRLVKAPAVALPAHGLKWVDARLDYELLVWVLWYGERIAGDQFVLTDLVRELELEIRQQIGAEHFDWNDRAHRLALQRAMRALEQMGMVRRIDGDIEDVVADRSDDALYEFTPLAQQMPVALADDLYDTIVLRGDATVLQRPLSDASTPEQRLYRALLLNPAVSAADDPDAFHLLTRRERRRQIAADLEMALGWDLEVTASFACLLRPMADAVAQVSFPGWGTLAGILVLLCGYLRDAAEAGRYVPDAFDRLRLSTAQVDGALTDLTVQYGDHWSAEYRNMGHTALVTTVTDTMREWGFLVGPDADGYVLIMPWAARYRGEYRAVPEASTDD